MVFCQFLKKIDNFFDGPNWGCARINHRVCFISHTSCHCDGLSLLAIERDAAEKLDIDSIIDKFANSKAQAVK